jgi:hypothetical protein
LSEKNLNDETLKLTKSTGTLAFSNKNAKTLIAAGLLFLTDVCL